MKYKKILTIMLALVMLIGSVTPVVAETRGDPIVRSIIEDEELVPAEGSDSQEKPPIVTVLPSGNDDELVPGEDPNDKLVPAEDPNDKLIPAEVPDDKKPFNPNDKDEGNDYVDGDWTRPYNPDMGLTKDGKNLYTTNPGGPGFGDSYTYQQWAAIMLNWAGVKYHPHLFGNQGGSPGTGTDKKTGQTTFYEPEIKYDVIVVDDEKYIKNKNHKKNSEI